VLEMAGAKVHYCEDHTGHKTSSSCIKTLQEFLFDSGALFSPYKRDQAQEDT
jgi:hypothetical protein